MSLCKITCICVCKFLCMCVYEIVNVALLEWWKVILCRKDLIAWYKDVFWIGRHVSLQNIFPGACQISREGISADQWNFVIRHDSLVFSRSAALLAALFDTNLSLCDFIMAQITSRERDSSLLQSSTRFYFCIVTFISLDNLCPRWNLFIQANFL